MEGYIYLAVAVIIAYIFAAPSFIFNERNKK